MRRILLVTNVVEPYEDRVIWAQAEIAITLIEGVEDGDILSYEYDSLKVKLAQRDKVFLDWGIPSETAWRYLAPYIDENNSITLRRNS